MEESKDQNVLLTPNSMARKRSVNPINKNSGRIIMQSRLLKKHKLSKKSLEVKSLFQPQTSKLEVRKKVNK